MARPRPTQPVKLICGLLSGDPDLLRRAKQLLRQTLGPIDLESAIWPFFQTDYYAEEMGPDLKRQFVSFDRPINPEEAANIKHETNALEERIAEDCAGLDVPRPVNLDPGYIDLGKLVLMTTKDNAHRVYIGQHMYAEVTLRYGAGTWHVWPWTYADYHQEHYHAFFTQVRERLREQRRRLPEALGEESL